jgi:hypothetical protein
MSNQRKTKRKTQRRRRQKGGFAMPLNKIPLHSFYPQNRMEVDPQRMGIVGGSRKHHSRKYLKRGGGWGFFGDLGTLSGGKNVIDSTLNNHQNGTNYGSRFLV